MSLYQVQKLLARWAATIDFCQPIPIFAVSCTTARMAVSVSA